MLCKLILFGEVDHMLSSHCILVSLRLINNVVFPKLPFFCVCFSSKLPSSIGTTHLLPPPPHSSSFSIHDATPLCCTVGKQCFLTWNNKKKTYLCFMLAKNRASYLSVFCTTKDKTGSGEMIASDEF